MLRVLDNGSGIKKAQRRFVKQLKQFMDEEISVIIGYPGGHFKGKVSWASKLGIWVLSRTISGSRYWNGFGIGRPKEGSMIPIVCEINFPLSGINRRIGGAFAEDDSGDIFVIQRGMIGGGKKGIGKSLFEENYRGERTSVADGRVENTIALIGALNSSRFARQVSQFVLEVGRIKGLASSPPLQIETFLEV